MRLTLMLKMLGRPSWNEKVTACPKWNDHEDLHHCGGKKAEAQCAVKLKRASTFYLLQLPYLGMGTYVNQVQPGIWWLPAWWGQGPDNVALLPQTSMS